MADWDTAAAAAPCFFLHWKADGAASSASHPHESPLQPHSLFSVKKLIQIEPQIAALVLPPPATSQLIHGSCSGLLRATMGLWTKISSAPHIKVAWKLVEVEEARTYG